MSSYTPSNFTGTAFGGQGYTNWTYPFETDMKNVLVGELVSPDALNQILPFCQPVLCVAARGILTDRWRRRRTLQYI